MPTAHYCRDEPVVEHHEPVSPAFLHVRKRNACEIFARLRSDNQARPQAGNLECCSGCRIRCHVPNLEITGFVPDRPIHAVAPRAFPSPFLA